MKILSAPQIREADQYTISHERIPSLDLMERAAAACVQAIQRLAPGVSQAAIVCGKGNNGGDGLAVARLLADRGYKVQVYILDYTPAASDDFAANLARLSAQAKVAITYLGSAADMVLPDGGIVIDAILGTGINKPAQGLIADAIKLINSSGRRIISIDVPSGLRTDEPTMQKDEVVKAWRTLTFQQPKLAFMFPESGAYTGEFEVLDIGIDSSFIPESDCTYFYVSAATLLPLLKGRTKFSHKGTYGHALLLAGSYGKMGAAVLSASAALHCGAGLLTVHLPACGYQIMQTALPEAMVSIDREEEHISTLPDMNPYTAVGIGPGIGTDPATAQLVKQVIQAVSGKLVVDADALNILSEHKTWLEFLPPLTILTPHPKEFDRLTQKHDSSWARLETAQKLAMKNNLVIVLKGAHTATVLPDRSVWFNSTGNPALAKGGSGDVLTGILAGLLARDYEPAVAACLGVYLHGHAADIGVERIHTESFLASDVIHHISDAMRQIYNGKTS
ncbi:MAG: NAD(P)H-hydrate dehydratase [Bacteroidetes bacterium]|nr:NAD(P)H-hydrate dehydratase [Bacteroidota bacterium]